jgi:hypothetical protein
MFKVKFREEGRERPVTLFAEEVDTSTPFVMTVKSIRQENRSGKIIMADDDYEEFSKMDFVTFPVHSLVYFGQVKVEAVHKVSPLVPVE